MNPITMVFSVKSFVGLNKARELNAFRSADTWNKNDAKIWAKMNAAFSKGQGESNQNKTVSATSKKSTASLRYESKRSARNSDLNTGIENDFKDLKLFEKRETMKQCAPIVHGISPFDNILTKEFEGDRNSIDFERKPKLQREKSWGSQKGRVISDFARSLISGVKIMCTLGVQLLRDIPLQLPVQQGHPPNMISATFTVSMKKMNAS